MSAHDHVPTSDAAVVCIVSRIDAACTVSLGVHGHLTCGELADLLELVAQAAVAEAEKHGLILGIPASPALEVLPS